MPLALALLASALIHIAAIVSPGWTLPGVNEVESAPTLDAVLTRPPLRQEAAPVAKPAPKPVVDRPRPHPATLAAVAPVATSPAPASEVPVVETPPAAAAGPRSGIPVTQSEGTQSEPVPAPAAATPAPLPQSALPGKGRLRYVITRGEGGFVIGQSVHTWEHDGLSYKLQSVTETTGLAAIFKPARVVQTSRGEVTAEGLKPHEFRNERVGALDTASFDWTRRIVAYAGREESIVAGTQDMLSMYYQIALLAPKSGALDMPIATGRKLETFRIEILGEEVVAMASGERRATHLRTRSGNDSIEIWIAPDMRGLPLKIRFTDRKGEIFDQLADGIDIPETP